MNTRGKSPRTRSGAAGFTLFAVLLAVAFMAGIVATFGRHVIVAGRSGMASPALLASREAASSGIAWARQSIVSGNGAVAGTVPVGEVEATVAVTAKPSGHQVVSVESFGGDGRGARPNWP